MKTPRNLPHLRRFAMEMTGIHREVNLGGVAYRAVASRLYKSTGIYRLVLLSHEGKASAYEFDRQGRLVGSEV